MDRVGYTKGVDPDLWRRPQVRPFLNKVDTVNATIHEDLRIKAWLLWKASESLCLSKNHRIQANVFQSATRLPFETKLKNTRVPIDLPTEIPRKYPKKIPRWNASMSATSSLDMATKAAVGLSLTKSRRARVWILKNKLNVSRSLARN